MVPVLIHILLGFSKSGQQPIEYKVFVPGVVLNAAMFPYQHEQQCDLWLQNTYTAIECLPRLYSRILNQSPEHNIIYSTIKSLQLKHSESLISKTFCNMTMSSC